MQSRLGAPGGAFCGRLSMSPDSTICGDGGFCVLRPAFLVRAPRFLPLNMTSQVTVWNKNKRLQAADAREVGNSCGHFFRCVLCVCVYMHSVGSAFCKRSHCLILCLTNRRLITNHCFRRITGRWWRTNVIGGTEVIGFTGVYIL